MVSIVEPSNVRLGSNVSISALCAKALTEPITSLLSLQRSPMLLQVVYGHDRPDTVRSNVVLQECDINLGSTACGCR